MYDELTSLFDEARLMIHRSVVAVEQLHAGSGVTVPMRAVLEFLRHNGEHTVSAVARARSVSRQHIQTIVNDLLAAGLVERIDNPHHLRAPLIGLTQSGVETIDEMHTKERQLLEPLIVDAPGVTRQRLEAAVDVLRSVGAELEHLNHPVTPQESP